MDSKFNAYSIWLSQLPLWAVGRYSWGTWTAWITILLLPACASERCRAMLYAHTSTCCVLAIAHRPEDGIPGSFEIKLGLVRIPPFQVAQDCLLFFQLSDIRPSREPGQLISTLTLEWGTFLVILEVRDNLHTYIKYARGTV
ncbi:hypothetical protein F5X99DRAFT_403722 [Biscogniauxia marginata]|nr:hypothetical protein F5X99DRAFT_403722 [Biscogniauxia marginata]